MPVGLTRFNDELLKFEPGLPADFQGPILHGANCHSARSDLGQIIVQDLIAESYTARFSIIFFLKNVIAKGSIHAPGLYSVMMMRGSLRSEVETLGKMHIRQNQYSCIYTKGCSYAAKFEKNIEYASLDLFYTPELIGELAGYFPELKSIMLANRSMNLGDKICWMQPSMKEIINQLLTCPYDQSTRQFYFDLKVRELLYHTLENAHRRRTEGYRFTTWEIARIHEARKMLENYISIKPPSIRSLSKLVAINEFKLKIGFRQYFKMGIFEYLLERKMQYAKELLLTTNYPIKDICARVGYPRITNFITAFRRRFGMTPGSLRRQ